MPRPVEHIFFGAFLVAVIVLLLLIFGGIKFITSLHRIIELQSWTAAMLDGFRTILPIE
jgi:hypothetical protein